MSEIWLVWAKIAIVCCVIFFAAGIVMVIYETIDYNLNKAREKNSVKKGSGDPGEDFDARAAVTGSLEALVTEMTERGIVTKCSASNRCAAVFGIMESEREYEQLRIEYEEQLKRYKNLEKAYEGQREAFERLEKDYRELETLAVMRPSKSR